MRPKPNIIGTQHHIEQYDLRNFKGRAFFVTDIHGHFDLLHEGLRDVAFDFSTDILFVGGDWTDRGPESHWVLDYIYEPWVRSVRGNHCQMFVDGFDDDWNDNNWNTRTLKAHGGDWIWNLDHQTQQAIRNAFHDLPLAIELILPRGRKVGIVHAEVPYNDWNMFTYITKTELDGVGHATCQWARRWYDSNYQGQVKGVDFVLCGHTPTDSGDVEKVGNMVFCDGGSFFRKKLNIIELNDEFMRKMK